MKEDNISLKDVAFDEKALPVFYKRKDGNKCVNICLWRTAKNPMVFAGYMDGRPLQAHRVNGRNGIHLNLVLQETGKRVGIAGVRSGHKGIPKLLVSIGDVNHWLEVSKQMSDDQLESLGLDLGRAKVKRAGATAACT